MLYLLSSQVIISIHFNTSCSQLGSVSVFYVKDPQKKISECVIELYIAGERHIDFRESREEGR